MESSTSSAGNGIPRLDLTFGFDNANFSDRTLLLEIIESGSHADEKSSNNSKKRRLSNVNAAPRVRTIHISSLILAGRSAFFHKLFTNGMRESKQKHATLQIEALEEVSFMNLLKYVYSNNLPTTFDALLDLLVIADKFEVNSCLRDCTLSLQNFPMTYESASIYLDLSSSLMTSLTIQPLIASAKQFLAAHYKELDKYKDEVLNLSLAGIQAVLSSDDLVVTSEFVVYDLVLRWAKKHYPGAEERREMLKTHLLNLVRFPFMTTTELMKKVKTCVDIEPGFASKIAFDALCFKAGPPHLIAEEGNAASRQFVKRAYKHRPVKVVAFELPHRHSIVHFDLTRDELKNVFPEGRIRSETFHFGSLELYLLAGCSIGAIGQRHFWLSLNTKGSTNIAIEYNIALKKKTSKEYETWVQRSNTHGSKYAIKWEDFIADDSHWFINDIFQVRVDLSLKYDHLDNIVA